MAANPYRSGLDRVAANYQALTPLGFLERSAAVFPDELAIVHGERRIAYAEFYRRCRRLASGLAKRRIKRGDTVAALASNIPAHLELHFGVPMLGAVLNSINTRLDAAAIAFILAHAEAKVLFADREFSGLLKEALAKLKKPPIVIGIDDAQAPGPEPLGESEYEAFLAEGDPEFAWVAPKDEWDAITLNYTSGTTGNPKGVVYHHRGAYLNAIGNLITWEIPRRPVYLWTLPMFHCNGWCFPWSITAQAGTHVCLRRVDPKAIFQNIAEHGVTHFCGAPTVLNMLLNSPKDARYGVKPGVKVMTAGAAPPAPVIAAMEDMGFEIAHVYGLTETLGPGVICEWHEGWNRLPPAERAQKKARQGVRYLTLETLDVLDPETMRPLPADGRSVGEIMFRGNTVMKGYLKNKKATNEAFAGGWFHSGDLAVKHADGYVQIRDRSKDIIISGGENISTLEVEEVLYRHAAVMEAAVVARPDAHWGETPCAFLTLKSGARVTEAEIIDFCRQHLAKFKCPKTIVFTDLPKTSTGKIQKFVLREWAKSLPQASKL
jgi:fatty-acyl-CoA synthase